MNMRKTEVLKIKRIKQELKRSGRKGIWISELARRLEMNKTTLHYYIKGQNKGGKTYDGFFKEKIEVVAINGRNKIIRTLK